MIIIRRLHYLRGSAWCPLPSDDTRGFLILLYFPSKLYIIVSLLSTEERQKTTHSLPGIFALSSNIILINVYYNRALLLSFIQSSTLTSSSREHGAQRNNSFFSFLSFNTTIEEFRGWIFLNSMIYSAQQQEIRYSRLIY